MELSLMYEIIIGTEVKGKQLINTIGKKYIDDTNITQIQKTEGELEANKYKSNHCN